MKQLLVIPALLLNHIVVAQSLRISPLDDSTCVFTTWQDYQGTPVSSHGLIKSTSAGVILIDTPWDTTQFQPLLDSVKVRFNQEVKLVISTHSHADRTAGLNYYASKGISTYSSFSTWKICGERGEPQAEHVFYHDTLFQIGNITLRTFFPGAGHAPDNIVIWFPDNKLLYGGCFIKSTDATDLGNRADANLGTWADAIRLTQNTFPHPKWIIPGHGSWESRRSLIHTLKLIRKVT